MVFSSNLPEFIEIINFGALLDHVIKYTQYFPNQSLTETLTRSNSKNQKQFQSDFSSVYVVYSLFSAFQSNVTSSL